MRIKPKTFICDLDGTIADNSHRTPWVENKPKNWLAYNKAMNKDKVIEAAASVIHTLEDNYNLIFCTGREEVYRDVTEAWLKEHYFEGYTELKMRKEKDYRGDEIVKEEMLKEIQEQFDVIAVFDDRPKVVEMWRKNGLFVFDCRQDGRIF